MSDVNRDVISDVYIDMYIKGILKYDWNYTKGEINPLMYYSSSTT